MLTEKSVWSQPTYTSFVSDQPTNGTNNDVSYKNVLLFHAKPHLFPHPGPHFVAVNNKNEIIVTDFHNHSVKVKRSQRFPYVDAVFGSSNPVWCPILGLQRRRRVLVQIWLPWWRQRPVQRSHWSGRGRKRKHHRSRLGQQQNTGGSLFRSQDFEMKCNLSKK